MLEFLFMAHFAQSGWMYDPACCSDRDCQSIDTAYVSFTEEGYVVSIPEGGHMFAGEGREETIPYNHSRVRRSGDDKYHACITPGGTFLCFYVPDMLG